MNVVDKKSIYPLPIGSMLIVKQPVTYPYLPIRCIAQGECPRQEAKVQDGLGEVQHPGIGTDKVKLGKQRKMHEDTWRCSPSKHSLI